MRRGRKRVPRSVFRVPCSGRQAQGPKFQVPGSRFQARRLTRYSLLVTRYSEGFTLLEVLVALAVLAVALVSLLGLQNRNLLLTVQAERLSTATLLVREMLTRTLLEGPEAARVTSGDFSDLHPGQYPEFRWRRTVRPAPVEGLWELRVGVTWGEREDERAELTLFTPLN
jgi:general secretion pathway protein I